MLLLIICSFMVPCIPSGKILFVLELPFTYCALLPGKNVAYILLGLKCHSYENCPHYPYKSYCKASSWDILISHCFSTKLGYFVLLVRDPVKSLPIGP